MFSKNRKRFALVPVALVTGVGIALVVGLGIFNRARGVELPERGVEIPLINLQNTALGLVAGRNRLPVHELEVVNSTTATYPLTGKTAFAFKVAHRAEKIFIVHLDEIGRELDGAQLMAAEQAAYAAKYGKLDPALAERLAGAPEDELIMVHIWLKAPPFTPPPAPDVHTPMTKDAPAQMEAYYKQLQSELAAAMAPVIAPIVERLAQRGIVDVMTNKYDPIIYARLTPKLIREVAAWDEVDQVYMSQKGYDELENARPTIGADAVNGRGITGTGVRVAHLDIGSRIAANNPYLSGVTQDTTYVCASPSAHTTAVAGVIRSTPTPLNVTTMQLYAGNRVRAVIAWDTDPDYASYTTRPSADLDLWVINPSGAIASTSLSWDNTYEIVDFTADYTGQYTLRVVRVRCDADPRYLGWAWWQGI